MPHNTTTTRGETNQPQTIKTWPESLIIDLSISTHHHPPTSAFVSRFKLVSATVFSSNQTTTTTKRSLSFSLLHNWKAEKDEDLRWGWRWPVSKATDRPQPNSIQLKLITRWKLVLVYSQCERREDWAKWNPIHGVLLHWNTFECCA